MSLDSSDSESEDVVGEDVNMFADDTQADDGTSLKLISIMFIPNIVGCFTAAPVVEATTNADTLQSPQVDPNPSETATGAVVTTAVDEDVPMGDATAPETSSAATVAEHVPPSSAPAKPFCNDATSSQPAASTEHATTATVIPAAGPSTTRPESDDVDMDQQPAAEDKHTEVVNGGVKKRQRMSGR